MTSEPTSEASEYYEHVRTEILEKVPPTASRVLSVGCGAGATEFELVKKGVEVHGIETVPLAAHRARQRGIHVVEGDAESVDANMAGQHFDCLVYADILEHLVDPEAVLQKQVELLDPGGRVIISIPNFRYFSVIIDLVFRGGVTYVDAGILDRTHLRITTRRMVEGWLKALDLEISGREYLLHGRRDRLLSKLFLGLGDEFLGKQVIVTAEKVKQ